MNTEREQIARALGEAWITSGPRDWNEQSEARRAGARHLADALLPLVDRIASERAAAELRAAADDVRGWPGSWAICAELDERARVRALASSEAETPRPRQKAERIVVPDDEIGENGRGDENW